MLNVKIPARIESRIAKVAERAGKTPAAIIQAALEAYLERGEWLDNAILQGLKSAAAEPRVAHKKVWENFEKRREQHIKKQRKAA